MNNYYSRTTYYMGDSNIFAIPFSYIDTDNVKVYIDGSITNEYTFPTPTSIQITDNRLVEGVQIDIQRDTPIQDNIVIYSNGSMLLDNNNLNLSQEQLLHAIQELADKTNSDESLSTLDNRLDIVESSLTDFQQAETTEMNNIVALLQQCNDNFIDLTE